MKEDRDSLLVDFTLDDAPFTEVDTSKYSLSPCSPQPGARPSKTAPAVMDDLVRSGYGAAEAQNQLFKMDLAELDHIMEVLVGSWEETFICLVWFWKTRRCVCSLNVDELFR